MVKTAIATVVKNELDYIEDFITYHLDIGIDEIFIYEDYGYVSHKEICDKYDNVYLSSILDIFPRRERGNIIKMRKNNVPPQTTYINQILKYLHPTHNDGWWIWLIDIDEYITSTEPISDVLSRFSDRDSVLVYWKNFGCSGHIYKPKYDKPIWEIFTQQCGYEQYSDLKYYKITKFCVNMNKWKPTQKYYIHNASVNWVKVDGSYKRTEIVYEPLYLRHYITKSVEEYAWKVWVRLMFHNGHRQWKSLFEMCPEVKNKIDNDFFEYFKQKYGVELPKW